MIAILVRNRLDSLGLVYITEFPHVLGMYYAPIDLFISHIQFLLGNVYHSSAQLKDFFFFSRVSNIENFKKR